MKKFWISAILFIAILSINNPCVLSAGLPDEEKVVNVAVFNDALHPSKEKDIKKNLKIAFKEYKEKVNITLKYNGEILSYKPTDKDLRLLNLDSDIGERNFTNSIYRERLNKYLLSLRPDAEIKIIFSDIPTDDTAGLAVSEIYGIIIIYTNEEEKIVWRFENGRWALYLLKLPETDAGGHPVVSATIKHEIGHLFGLGHTDDMLSFMYPNVNRSFGLWTEDIIKMIKKNKNRRWNGSEY